MDKRNVTFSRLVPSSSLSGNGCGISPVLWSLLWMPLCSLGCKGKRGALENDRSSLSCSKS